MRSEQNARKLIERARNAAPYAVNHALLTGLADALEEALREQPEARGVVDGLPWELRQRAKHAGVVTGELLNKAADALDALTAAQQPGQEGGGEVATLSVDRTGAHIEMLPAWQSLSHGEYPLYTTPPSAPVGLSSEDRLVLMRLKDALPDVGLNGWIDGVRVIERILTQQPAQAAPGYLTADEREWLDYAIEHMRDDSEPEDLTCADVLEALLQRATPPGDDAAGGG